MGRLPRINRRIFDNTKPHAPPPPCGAVGKSQSDFPGGGTLPNNDDLQSRARRLRTNATQAERLLGFSLRALKQRGHHFRRQSPMRHYILDFVCPSAKLVIELDGSQHADPETELYDARRTAFLQSQGYRVLRFWNGAVLYNGEHVMSEILHALEPPTRIATRSDLPPRGGEGSTLPHRQP